MGGEVESHFGDVGGEFRGGSRPRGMLVLSPHGLGQPCPVLPPQSDQPVTDFPASVSLLSEIF